jgi:hypothetical protein
MTGPIPTPGASIVASLGLAAPSTLLREALSFSLFGLGVFRLQPVKESAIIVNGEATY